MVLDPNPPNVGFWPNAEEPKFQKKKINQIRIIRQMYDQYKHFKEKMYRARTMRKIV